MEGFRTFALESLTNKDRFAIVAAKFNSIVVDRLVEGAFDAFRLHRIPKEQIDLVRVPGSFELPIIAKKLAQKNCYLSIIAIGAVIRGDTDHYDYVASAAANGIAQVALQTDTPIVFGVLTCNTLEQALDRAGGKAGNKGGEAAITAIEMASLIRQLSVTKS